MGQEEETGSEGTWARAGDGSPGSVPSRLRSHGGCERSIATFEGDNKCEFSLVATWLRLPLAHPLAHPRLAEAR